MKDIRQAASDLRNIVADMDTEAFHALPHADRMSYRAVKNALSELGEAVKALPNELRARHPGVDWRGFAGLRIVFAHQYFGFDVRMLLPVIQTDLPRLLAAVELESAAAKEPEPKP